MLNIFFAVFLLFAHNAQAINFKSILGDIGKTITKAVESDTFKQIVAVLKPMIGPMADAMAMKYGIPPGMASGALNNLVNSPAFNSKDRKLLAKDDNLLTDAEKIEKKKLQDNLADQTKMFLLFQAQKSGDEELAAKLTKELKSRETDKDKDKDKKDKPAVSTDDEDEDTDTDTDKPAKTKSKSKSKPAKKTDADDEEDEDTDTDTDKDTKSKSKSKPAKKTDDEDEDTDTDTEDEE